MRAKKSYGQHFLKHVHVAQRIVEAALRRKARYDVLLEVGPGKGIMTELLLHAPVELYAVELDPEMVAYLRSRFRGWSGLIHGDFLRLDIAAQWRGRQVGIIGNFPYQISSQIVFKVVEQRAFVPLVVGMFQREMAMRIVASPASKDYGILSVWSSLLYDIEVYMHLAPGAFSPPPKVHSTVLVMERKEDYQLPCADASLKKVLKAAFQHRRKVLRKAVQALGMPLDAVPTRWLTMRAEQLHPEEFVQWAVTYEMLGQKTQ